jgi:UDP-N-acetylglucosamine 2-epimerase (non-hydrolysing)
VLTLRNTTERPETVEAGSNIVTSTDPDQVTAAARFLKPCGKSGIWNPPPEYTVGNVTEIVARVLHGQHVFL